MQPSTSEPDGVGCDESTAESTKSTSAAVVGLPSVSHPGRWLLASILLTFSASAVKMLGPYLGTAYPEPVPLVLRGITLLGGLFIMYFSVLYALRTNVS